MAKKKNTFTVNGRKYIGRVFDFNTAADLDFMGLSVSDFGKKNLAMARAYLALYNGNDVEWAGREIQAHIVNTPIMPPIISPARNNNNAKMCPISHPLPPAAPPGGIIKCVKMPLVLVVRTMY